MAKGGVVGRVALRNGLLGFGKKAITTTKRSAQDTALIAAIIAKNAGQNVIATVPSSLRPGKIGRIWTGAMYTDFDADVTQTGNKITIKYGWISRKQKYYMTQEHGGFFIGKTITPMNALVTAKITMENYLNDKGIK